MPTTRPRHAITETDEIEAAIDAAAKRWPELAGNRARLLTRLVSEGHRSIVDDDRSSVRRRRDVVRRTAGELDDVFPDGYLDRLREDWPE